MISATDVDDGRRRAVIEAVAPEVDGGRYPIKRAVGERVDVEADVFSDGHDVLACVVQYRREGAPDWQESRMRPLVNDRWRGQFIVDSVGRFHYTICAWADPFLSWRHDLSRRVVAQDIAIALQVGARMLEAAIYRAGEDDGRRLREWLDRLLGPGDVDQQRATAMSDGLLALMSRYPDRHLASRYERELCVVVDRPRARCSAWYEFFPRSCVSRDDGHGHFKGCEARLAYVAELGFDVVYLPPIHPIGHSNRKGRNNALHAGPEDPGSPWAIGAETGGHKAVHPELGTIDDFCRFADSARRLGMEVALDIALQCSPDHPYVQHYPHWFRWRPDRTIQYAENPPKKYEDIYPLNFESEDWRGMWAELKSIFDFWIAQGVSIFRVDNPHTKPFQFWEWLIAEVKRDHPDTLFLAEAFSRPKIMRRLAKLGFTQSYTYFTWRNTKYELQEYFTELTQPDVREYFRANLWPNTPDILSEYLQYGGRSAFMTRLVLAATLGASYGIYGPAFELLDHTPREPGSEEYLDSEKYEIRQWDLDRADSLKDFIKRINRIRRDNPALHSDWTLRFHIVDNDQIICYSKHTEDLGDVILVVVNLDAYYKQSGWVHLPLETLDLAPEQPYQVHDLISDARYLWHGARNYVELDPKIMPAQIFRLRRRIRTEKDFAYYF